MGDVLNGQVPTSVHIPDNLFNQLPAVQVPTDGLMAQLLQAEPNAPMLGPFAASEADVTPVVTRSVVVVPNEYARLFLTTGMRPREAYQALMGLLLQRNHDIACEPLLEWLRVALTRRGANALPRTVIDLLCSMHALVHP
eukprot:CAMPEP_0170201798 /NCGR_PEP_ID=MMETSP0116_2-20130129/364_1 /TAXON_ID=400756 /ORGANISM="Durinskia baltica, Strain CSIRO CS-38" /LENGTH=139 /DNA_ID=CAMNT_0010452031 /DNA_START=256 /DNA_END=671 /DNA_ORIENTATION=-